MSNKRTDLQRFLDFYASVGVELHPEMNEDMTIHVELRPSSYAKRPDSKLIGYTHFFSLVEFTGEGEFITQGFWE